MSCLTKKAQKKAAGGFVNFLRVYDADTDEIASTWLRLDYTLNCPILKTCLECGRCIRK